MHLHSLVVLGATLLSWLIAFAWVARTWDLYRNIGRVPNLLAPGFEPSPLGGSGEKLAVIVPACNEQAAISSTLHSLLLQEGLELEIVAVDDRSQDRTGAIMDQIAEELAVEHAIAPAGTVSLRVLHIRDLPEGWMGKQHALAAGVAATDAPYLLFTDGDIYFRPDALCRALGYVIAERADHFVVLPTPVIQSSGEHMMISALQVYSAWAVRLWNIADPHRKDCLGVGAFNLVRREAYESIGGFAALRMEVLEDVRLGVEMKRRGFRQRVAFGAGLVTLHWATGVSGVVRNVTKNFFAAVRFDVPTMLAAAVTLSVLGIYPLLGFFGPLATQLASVVTLLALLAFYKLVRGPAGSSPLYAFLFPVATVCVVYAMLRSMVLTLARGAVRWRGTSYPLAELRRQAGPLR